MSSYVMINGQIHPSNLAQIPALDRGFLYGDCIYEIFAAKSGVLIDFESHIKRLRVSAGNHEIPIPWSNEIIRFDIEHLLTTIKADYVSIRLVVSRGLGGALIPTQPLTPQRYLFANDVPFPVYSTESEPLRLKTRRHPAPHKGDVAKTNNYLSTISRTLEGANEGFDDVLWVSPEGELLETGSANIFFLSREGDLVEIATPPLGSGILPGITRQRVIELLSQAKIPVTERIVTIEELPRFDEAFLCSSIRLLRPVSLIDRHRLHSSRKNATFWHIHRLYNTWLTKIAIDSHTPENGH